MRGALILLAAVLHSAMILWGVLDQARLIRSGTEVVLAARAIDPRDLLRGHYVTLDLDLSELPITFPAPDPQPGAPVWVTLDQQPDGLWQATGLVTTDPAALAIRGLYLARDDRHHILSFDIARYYAPRDRALALENAMQRGAVAVILALAPDGRAVLRGVVVDGVRHLDRLF